LVHKESLMHRFRATQSKQKNVQKMIRGVETTKDTLHSKKLKDATRDTTFDELMTKTSTIKV